MKRTAGLLVTALLAIASLATPAAAADMIMVRVDEPGICGHSAVLGKITSRFRHQVTHVPNLPLVDIDGFHRIRESRYLPQRHNRPVERRYCHARVALSDGRSRDIYYLIERPMGFAGIGSNVTFCVSGFDRWYVNGGRCRSVRPPRTS